MSNQPNPRHRIQAPETTGRRERIVYLDIKFVMAALETGGEARFITELGLPPGSTLVAAQIDVSAQRIVLWISNPAFDLVKIGDLTPIQSTKFVHYSEDKSNE